jgi:hypothetical protein
MQIIAGVPFGVVGLGFLEPQKIEGMEELDVVEPSRLAIQFSQPSPQTQIPSLNSRPDPWTGQT